MAKVISLGGSLIYPDSIDINLLHNFSRAIEPIAEKEQCAVICGGGMLARNYQHALRTLRKDSTNDELDRLGIDATRINARLLHTILPTSQTHPEIITDYSKNHNISERFVVCAGGEPGHSTNMDAVLIAKSLGANEIIKMSNITHVYDSDPKINDGAKRLTTIGWQDYRALLPEKFTPGYNSPFDPVAAKEAQNSGISVKVIGPDLENMVNALNGRQFEGTTIY